MKLTQLLIAATLLAGSFAVQAAGSPMNEDFSNLIQLSGTIVDAGKQGDSKGFIEKAQSTLETLKKQDEKGSSIRLQRASTRLKAGIKAAKDGKLENGIAEVEQSIAIMSEKH